MIKQILMRVVSGVVSAVVSFVILGMLGLVTVA